MASEQEVYSSYVVKSIIWKLSSANCSRTPS